MCGELNTKVFQRNILYAEMEMEMRIRIENVCYKPNRTKPLYAYVHSTTCIYNN